MNFWYRGGDRVIGQRIALGKYEGYESELMKTQIGKEDVCVDVGANIGFYTILMARRAKRVYALEPEEKSYEILKKNVEENNLKNVVLLKMAASDKNEKKFLKIDMKNYGNGKICDGNGQAILTKALDKILEHEQKISLIKVDTQGWEPEVILGAQKIIKRDSPTLFLEYTPGEYRDNKMINFLKKIYKNFWSINDFAEVPWPIYKGIKIRGRNNYTDLFIKKKMELRDYLTMIKEIKYKKFLKGIMSHVKDKNN